jgi:hypothetical protein
MSPGEPRLGRSIRRRSARRLRLAESQAAGLIAPATNSEIAAVNARLLASHA